MWIVAVALLLVVMAVVRAVEDGLFPASDVPSRDEVRGSVRLEHIDRMHGCWLLFSNIGLAVVIKDSFEKVRASFGEDLYERVRAMLAAGKSISEVDEMIKHEIGKK